MQIQGKKLKLHTTIKTEYITQQKAYTHINSMQITLFKRNKKEHKNTIFNHGWLQNISKYKHCDDEKTRPYKL